MSGINYGLDVGPEDNYVQQITLSMIERDEALARALINAMLPVLLKHYPGQRVMDGDGKTIKHNQREQQQ